MNARDGMRRLRAQRKEQGLCIYCGTCAPPTGFLNCEYCLAQKRTEARKRRARKRAERLTGNIN